MPATVPIAFDRYLSHAELSAHLQALATAFPRLCHLESIGKSFLGRDIWALTITNPDTGGPLDKPAYYLDAQIHAEEHATSLVALHTAWVLLHGFGSDALITRLLNEMTFYVLPRINPDGAEFSVQPPFYRWCGNGRFVPGTPDERARGLFQSDVNGDGFITRMRLQDPNGEWKVSSRDARVMIPREPGEFGGVYYRLYPEGLIPDFDGVEVTLEPTRDGNLNRQFPGGWEPESRQYGAGLYPGSEPESRAVMEFIIDRPNICGVNTFHTHGGLHLRPSGVMPDAEMNPHDLGLLNALGEVGTRITGYPCVSVFEHFTPDKSKVRRGCLDDWTFEELGIPSFTTELWDVDRAAGIPKNAFINNRRDEDAEIRLLEWVVEHVGDRGWQDWQAFHHPQLGQVEVGGLVDIWVFRNPPAKLLPDICASNTRFCLEHAAASPRVRVRDMKLEPLRDGVFRLRATVANEGFLPTNLSETALLKRTADPVRVRLELEGAEVLAGQPALELGHLAGRAERSEEWSPWGRGWERSARAVEWVVRVTDPHARASITAFSNKIGRQTAEVRFTVPG